MSDTFSPSELGKQLSCPEGLHAQAVGENMFASNNNMICKAIDILECKSMETVLEIGFGNGKHLDYLFRKYPLIQYQGIDVSEAMATEAKLNNAQWLSLDKAAFLKVDPEMPLPFSNATFDAFFSLNTIYFIADLHDYLKQLKTVLKPKAKLVLGFIDKDFGVQLPFTQEHFTFYETQALTNMLKSIGFDNITIHTFEEQAISKDGTCVTRPFSLLQALVAAQ